MKDLFGAFSSEFFRPLVTLFLPGALAILPWIVAFLQRFPAVRAMAENNHSDVVAVFVLASLFAGLFIEDVGSQIEAKIDKTQKNKEASEEWHSYLRLAFSIEPVGHRYLRTIVTRLKFELHCGLALIVGWLGQFLLQPDTWDGTARCWVSGVAFILAPYCFREARTSSDLLVKVRHELLKGEYKPESGR